MYFTLASSRLLRQAAVLGFDTCADPRTAPIKTRQPWAESAAAALDYPQPLSFLKGAWRQKKKFNCDDGKKQLRFENSPKAWRKKLVAAANNSCCSKRSGKHFHIRGTTQTSTWKLDAFTLLLTGSGKSLLNIPECVDLELGSDTIIWRFSTKCWAHLRHFPFKIRHYKHQCSIFINRFYADCNGEWIAVILLG